MLQSITWLILRKFKKIILIRKNHKLESTGGCGGGSDCSASRVIILPEEQQRKTYSLKHITTETVCVRYTPQYHEQ